MFIYSGLKQKSHILKEEIELTYTDQIFEDETLSKYSVVLAVISSLFNKVI